jgi:hypothetical protein
VNVRRLAIGFATILSLVLLAACGRSELPATQSHLGSGTSTKPDTSHTSARATPSEGCVSSGREVRSPPVTTTPEAPIAPAPWPEHAFAPVPGLPAINPASADAYALVSETTTPEQGPYRLQRTDLVDHSVRYGPLFSEASVAVLAGDLWVYGAYDARSGRPATGAEVCEVDPETLAVIRPFVLPPARPADGIMALAAGPAASIWIGYSQTLLRVDVTTGAVLDAITVPTGLVVSDVAVDPTGQFLYVSYAHNVGGPSVGAEEGAVVYEYDASSGGQLASTMTGPVTDSVAGASLVAVPGGVWASFRTGMAGLTVLLRQADLVAIARGTGDAPIGSVFHWMMEASVVYGDGTLFLAQEGGLVACIDPQTGQVRGAETLPSSSEQNDAISVLSVDGPAGLVYGGDQEGVIAVIPPASCWS